MFKNLFRGLLTAVLVTSLVTITLADSRSYTPPAETGTVYIIVRYRQGFGPQPTKISVRWGGYSLDETFSPPKKLLLPGSGIPEGFVIRLKHTKKDSLRIDVQTDGSIVNIYQGGEPSECRRGEYKCHNR